MSLIFKKSGPPALVALLRLFWSLPLRRRIRQVGPRRIKPEYCISLHFVAFEVGVVQRCNECSRLCRVCEGLMARGRACSGIRSGSHPHVARRLPFGVCWPSRRDSDSGRHTASANPPGIANTSTTCHRTACAFRGFDLVALPLPDVGAAALA